MKSLGVVGLLLVSTTVWAHPVRPGDAGGRPRPQPPHVVPHPPPPPPHRPPPPPPPPDDDVPPPVAVSDVMIDQRAEISDAGDPVRLLMTSGGKKPGVKLEAKAASIDLFNGEAIGTLKSAHGTMLVALSTVDTKEPFRVALFDGKKLSNIQKLARPAKQTNVPFAISATRTPDGFTVFFQEVELNNPNEAHTFMVDLDKTGKAGEVKEVQIPWALGDAIWNGAGYHLALMYTGEMRGARIAMVSATAAGVPQGHPDWATQPSAISDIHLVESDGTIKAIYRGGVGDHMFSTDVTKIGQWGQVTDKTTDLGALAANTVIAINGKGQPTKVKTTK